MIDARDIRYIEDIKSIPSGEGHNFIATLDKYIGPEHGYWGGVVKLEMADDNGNYCERFPNHFIWDRRKSSEFGSNTVFPVRIHYKDGTSDIGLRYRETTIHTRKPRLVSQWIVAGVVNSYGFIDSYRGIMSAKSLLAAKKLKMCGGLMTKGKVKYGEIPYIKGSSNFAWVEEDSLDGGKGYSPIDDGKSAKILKYVNSVYVEEKVITYMDKIIPCSSIFSICDDNNKELWSNLDSTLSGR